MGLPLIYFTLEYTTMKGTNNHIERQRDLKKKCCDFDDNNTMDSKEREKEVWNESTSSKSTTSNSSNLNLDTNNTDLTCSNSSELFDDYCQILLKDTVSNSNTENNNLDSESHILSVANQSVFNTIPSPQQRRVPLSVKLKNWALKNTFTITGDVLTELLIILRDEGYLDLPCTAENLLGTEYCQSATIIGDETRNRSESTDTNVADAYENVTVWIKKESQTERVWLDDASGTDGDTNDVACEDISSNEFVPLKNTSPGDSSVCPDFPASDCTVEEGTSAKKRRLNSNASDSDRNDNKQPPNQNIQHSKIYSIFKEELQEMEKRWSRHLESTKRSLLYDIVRKYEDLKGRISSSTRPLGTSFTDDREILGVKLPFKCVETFCEFDNSIADNPSKEIAMKSLMTSLCFGSGSLSSSIGCILSALLTKDLQMQYSACGKKIRGIKKRNFGDTHTFQYVKDVLREKHGTGDAEIISKTSRWFTGAGDRDGGRKERRTK